MGLRLNIKKCESLGKRITKEITVVSKIAAKTKERIEVKFDNGWFQGWKTEARWASLLGIDRDRKIKDANTVVLFDDGEVMFGVQKHYWLTDEDGARHKTHKLGMLKPLEKKKSRGHECSVCGSTFDSQEGLTRHHTSGWCRKLEDMDSKQLRRLHRTRQTAATRRGKSSETVELIKVAAWEGKLTKACGSFVYLGTLTKPSASATPGIRRRIGMALGAFGSLRKGTAN